MYQNYNLGIKTKMGGEKMIDGINEYVIQETDDNKELMQEYFQEVYIIKQIKDFLKQKFNKEFHTYSAPYHVFQNINRFHSKEEIDIDVIGRVFEEEVHTFDVNIAGNQEDFIQVGETNILRYIKQFDLVFVKIKLFNYSSSVYHERILFAPSHENITRFKEWYNEIGRNNNSREVVVIQATKKGLEIQKKYINHYIDKDKIVLDESMKEEIFNQIDKFLDTSDQGFFKKYDIPRKRGIILHGPPGNGKTSLIKTIPSVINAFVIIWQINEFTTTSAISDVFKEAYEKAPAILVIEDLNLLREELYSAFLNEIDGVTSSEGLFLIATTNYIDKIIPALKNRSGRFDRVYELTLPDQSLRKKYMFTRGFEDFLSLKNIEELADLTSGFSYAQLNDLFITIAMQVYDNKEVSYSEYVKVIKENNKKEIMFKSKEDHLGFR